MATLQRLIDEHTRYLDALDSRTRGNMLGVYQQALREIYLRLSEIQEDTLEYTRLLQIRAQLEQITGTMGQRLQQEMSSAQISLVDTQAQRYADTWTQLEQAFGDRAVASAMASFVPVIPHQTVRALSEMGTISIQSFTADINKMIGQQLTHSVTMGESIPKAMARIRQIVPVNTQSPSAYRNRLELIARMEILRADNTANTEIVKAINKQHPELDLWQQINDHIDKSKKTRNHYLSYAAHGTVRNVSSGENFHVLVSDANQARQEWQKITGRKVKEGAGVIWSKEDTPQGLAYVGAQLPAHFTDRATVTPWRPSWTGGSFPPPKHPQKPIQLSAI